MELLLVPSVLLAFLLWWEKRDRASERTDWTEERRELLTRLQHPEVIPIDRAVPPDEELLTVEEDPDYGLVGTIQTTPEENSDGG